jgi:probable addiction module antidote protein
MSKIKIRPFDASNYLNNEADIAAYLQSAIEEGDPALLAAALGDIAKARGMTQLARDTGLSRESLYKSLSGERAPSSDTLFKVIHAMGFKLSVEPLSTSSTT